MTQDFADTARNAKRKTKTLLSKWVNQKSFFIVSSILAFIIALRGFIDFTASILFIMGVGYDRNSLQFIENNATGLNKQLFMKTNDMAAHMTLAHGFLFWMIGFFVFCELNIFKRCNDQSLAEKRTKALFLLYYLYWFDVTCFALSTSTMLIYLPNILSNPYWVIFNGFSFVQFLNDVGSDKLLFCIILVYFPLSCIVFVSFLHQTVMKRNEELKAKTPKPILSSLKPKLPVKGDNCRNQILDKPIVVRV